MILKTNDAIERGSPKYCLNWHSRMTLRCTDVNVTTN